MKSILFTLSIYISIHLFGQNVYIPDTDFKSYLVANKEININGDEEIQLNEAIAFKGSIDCSYRGISNMTGIEFFTSLTELDCSSNQIKSLNVSKNSALTVLYCSANQLISLDITKNVSLIELGCGFNYLTNLDLTKNVELTDLYCHMNQLKSLNVSKNIALLDLTCWGNKLTSLDLSKNINLLYLTCDRNKLTSLDVSQNNSLKNLGCEDNRILCVTGVPDSCSLEGSHRCESFVPQSLKTSTITDPRDGNTYKTIIIGTQTWMAENLNTTKFRNGDLIPEARTVEEWIRASENQEPAWCYYNNDPKNGLKYGKLYNWWAVDDSRGLAPEGWEIPSYYKWDILTDEMGGQIISDEISQMKYIQEFVRDFNISAGGMRNGDEEGSFSDIGSMGVWWSSNLGNSCFAWFEDILATDVKLLNPKFNKYNTNIYYIVSNNGGFSVRCVKN